MKIEPFRIAIPDEDILDLKSRLQRVRPPADLDNDDWRYGTNTRYLQDLAAYWRDGYDWRQRETLMNAFAHYRTSIDGVPLHFIREPGRGPNPMPLVLCHGWPWTFWDMHKIIRPLADPAAFGGDAKDAFEVIVPSLPGYGFSTPLTRSGINTDTTADILQKLMTEGLGHQRFAVEGGDWGAFVGAQMGHKYAAHLTGLYLHLVPRLGGAFGAAPVEEDYEPSEAHWLKRYRNFFRRDSAYADIQATRPQTLAAALNDSPLGLLSWILEKRRSWSDSGGDVESVFSRDELLDTVSLYWFTQSAGSAARYYYERGAHPWRPAHDRTPIVEAHTAVAAFEHEILPLPRRWAERYYNIQQWTHFQHGGHFAPMEQPQVLIDDIRAFFRTRRG